MNLTVSEILEKVALSHGCMDDYGNDWDEQLGIIAEAERQINELILGIIGEDVVEEDDKTGKYKVNKYLVAENRLRREQRNRLKETEVKS